MKFDEVLVVGKGRVATECTKIARTKFDKVELVDMDKITDKDVFFDVLKDKFIISTNNFYLFKKPCVENNFIINYHNALLPLHRGANAHVWAVWGGDEKSGISWHEVEVSIDTGKVLIQKEIVLAQMSAGELLLAQHKQAILAFDELMNNKYVSKFKQDNINGGGLHKRGELPNDGVLNLSWEVDKIIRFLRAFDVGVFRDIPYAKVLVGGDFVDIVYYEITDEFINLSLRNDEKLHIKKRRQNE